ncbi:CCA tRNA nucleotidyltransferase [Leptolyngbya sp. 'hensonii']|uniref:CCA tRNA nucleotidyltransferase n=1 Tax=Leptolyngbya sp. 'hensonii' TaxID=1922337 RepID=UPI00209A98AD|nr:CCA tRNA nucleotidyltransferase [Leptolyngbya sp. 'hensonii']
MTLSAVLSPQTWPFNLKWLPHPTFLVGGSVRDALLERQSAHLDLDFVMPEGSVETARAIARHYKAGFVLLDTERQIARVVFDHATADFAQQVGPTLEMDLQRRDFTVNAIAYNPHTDQLIDPLQGYADLQQGRLRMIALDNLEEDPLRLLRAYRQAAQLNFSLEAGTQAAIRQLAPLLGRVAAERVQAELSYLFSTPKGTPWITAAWKDGLLNSWFPSATASSLSLLAAIERAAVILAETCPGFEGELSRWIRDKSSDRQPGPKAKLTGGSRRTWLSTAKLISLVSSTPPMAETELAPLKYSRAEIQAVTTILKFLPQIKQVVAQPDGDSCAIRRQQYHLFQGVGVGFPALAVVAVADGVPVAGIMPLIHRFLTPHDPVAHTPSLLTGQDLMTTLHLSAGPKIGQLLAEIQLAQAEGRISSRSEALELVTQLFFV